MKAKPKYTIRQDIRYMLSMAWKHQKSVIGMAIGLIFVNVGLNLVQLFVAPQILHKVEQAAPIGELLGTIGMFTLLLLILTTLQEFLKGDARQVGQIHVRTCIINDITKKSLTTSYPNTCDPQVGKLRDAASEATNGNAEATEHIWVTMTALLTNLGGFLVYLLLLHGLSPVLMLSVIAIAAASFFVNRRVNEWEYRNRDTLHQSFLQMKYIRDKSRSVELAKDIRIFGLGKWLRDIYDGLLRTYRALIMKRERAYIAASIADVLLSLARNAFAYGYLITLTLAQGLPASEFLLYFTAISGFTAWITGILSEASTLHKECLDIGVVQEYLNYPEIFRFAGGKPIPKADSYELKAENVTFRYPGAGKNLFENLNLTIRPGEKLAIVGLNGAGKSTLVKLLCGFYDPDAGRILLNGQDIREFDRRAYYGLLCAVYQQWSVLDATVAQNVASSNGAIDEARVYACLEKAGLANFIRQLPKGIHTPVGRDVYLDGVLFSGGQTQRLMLARALYKGGPILVLDEPTAALDPIAENDIYRKYGEMTAGKTSLFISHRLASTRFCDRIIFLADGQITEEGTHEGLMAAGGEYAKLFAVQSRYYQEGRDFR